MYNAALFKKLEAQLKNKMVKHAAFTEEALEGMSAEQLNAELKGLHGRVDRFADVIATTEGEIERVEALPENAMQPKAPILANLNRKLSEQRSLVENLKHILEAGKARYMELTGGAWTPPVERDLGKPLGKGITEVKAPALKGVSPGSNKPALHMDVPSVAAPTITLKDLPTVNAKELLKRVIVRVFEALAPVEADDVKTESVRNMIRYVVATMSKSEAAVPDFLAGHGYVRAAGQRLYGDDGNKFVASKLAPLVGIMAGVAEELGQKLASKELGGEGESKVDEINSIMASAYNSAYRSLSSVISNVMLSGTAGERGGGATGRGDRIQPGPAGVPKEFKPEYGGMAPGREAPAGAEPFVPEQTGQRLMEEPGTAYRSTRRRRRKRSDNDALYEMLLKNAIKRRKREKTFEQEFEAPGEIDRSLIPEQYKERASTPSDEVAKQRMQSQETYREGLSGGGRLEGFDLDASEEELSKLKDQMDQAREEFAQAHSSGDVKAARQKAGEVKVLEEKLRQVQGLHYKYAKLAKVQKHIEGLIELASARGEDEAFMKKHEDVLARVEQEMKHLEDLIKAEALHKKEEFVGPGVPPNVGTSVLPGEAKPYTAWRRRKPGSTI